MADFKELGLREELLSALEDADLERPTALQEAVIPALRRGTNVVARASSGAGKTLAYGLGVLDRLKPRDGGDDDETGELSLRFLVLTPTADVADRVAASLFPFAQAAGLTLTVAGGSWGTSAGEAEILVTPAGDLMQAVRSSALKLDDVEAVVIDGASSIAELGDWEAVDSAMELLPRDAQRVVVSPVISLPVQDLIERRVKRALSFPAEAALPEDRTPVTGTLGYVLVGEREKLDVLARQLRGGREGGGPAPVIFCRNDERAADLAENLSVRGFLIGAADDADVDVALAASDVTRGELLEETGGIGQTISFDVPADARTLAARHHGDGDAVVLVEPGQLAHIREIARQSGLGTRALPLPIEGGPTAQRLAGFRDQVRHAIQTEDLEAQMLLLEPLLEQFSAVEVAAGLAALLRNRRTAPQPAAESAPPAAPRARAEAGAAPATWSRLFVGVGSRDEIRPGDLVGALAGEANIPGSKIGKIEIRDSFSIVEVDAGVADAVIRSVNGTTMKGRSVRVDYDRGADRGRRSAGNAPPRRTNRKPPRD
jgi:ATP-dependent RNA helicase DeaD